MSAEVSRPKFTTSASIQEERREERNELGVTKDSFRGVRSVPGTRRPENIKEVPLPRPMLAKPEVPLKPLTKKQQRMTRGK